MQTAEVRTRTSPHNGSLTCADTDSADPLAVFVSLTGRPNLSADDAKRRITCLVVLTSTLTQAAIARAAGISRQRVSRLLIENRAAAPNRPATGEC